LHLLTVQVKTAAAAAVVQAPVAAPAEAGEAATHDLATGGSIAGVSSRKQKQELFRQAQQLLLQQQERLEQLRAEVTTLQERQQQLEHKAARRGRDAEEARRQLAEQQAATAALRAAKEEAEAVAERAQRKLAAAVDQAASMRGHVAAAQQEELEAYKAQLAEALAELDKERQERQQLKAEVSLFGREGDGGERGVCVCGGGK
jgi:DNA repair exonuclease SbcCD ATPase subunit